MSEQKSVLFICLGNICRSPIAAAVFKHLAKEKNVDKLWKCESAALGSWHVGRPMDRRSATVLSEHGIETCHKARQITEDDFRKFNYIFGMDHDNIKELKRMAPANSIAKIELLGSYDPEGKLIIRDPYYDRNTVGFEECYQICYRACEAFLDKQ